MNSIADQEFRLRPFFRDDRENVLSFLNIVPRLYPNGRQWLENRLTEVDEGKASCTLALRQREIVGAIIDVSKGRRLRKVSTFFVRPKFSRLGVGSTLYNARLQRWLDMGIDRIHITSAGNRVPFIRPFLIGKEFREIAVLPGRYCPDRSEHVYSLSLH